MIKSNLFYFIEEKNLELFLKSPKNYFETYYELKKHFSKFVIINFSKIIGEEVKNNNFKKKLKKKNIIYYCPSSYEKLIQIIKKGNNYGFFKSTFGFKYFKILRILKMNRIKLIQISNHSFIFEKKLYEGRTVKQSFRILFKMRLINYFHRLMCALYFYPKINVHFDCDQSRIDLINRSISKKIDKIIPFFKLSYYEKIIRINSKDYSDFLRLKQKKIEKKYITLCDSPMAHDDFLLRDGPYNISEVEKYYKNLFFFLKKIEKIFNKKLIICLHPKGKYKHFKNFRLIKDNFKTVYFKTDYYITKSYLVLNVISSTMNLATILNKPVIILKSKYYGNTVKGKIENILNELDYPSINIDNFKKENIHRVLKKNNSKKIKLYKKNRLFFEKNISDIQQIINFFKKNS